MAFVPNNTIIIVNYIGNTPTYVLIGAAGVTTSFSDKNEAIRVAREQHAANHKTGKIILRLGKFS